jgi:hypothetical protein
MTVVSYLKDFHTFWESLISIQYSIGDVDWLDRVQCPVSVCYKSQRQYSLPVLKFLQLCCPHTVQCGGVVLKFQLPSNYTVVKVWSSWLPELDVNLVEFASFVQFNPLRFSFTCPWTVQFNRVLIVASGQYSSKRCCLGATSAINYISISTSILSLSCGSSHEWLDWTMALESEYLHLWVPDSVTLCTFEYFK